MPQNHSAHHCTTTISLYCWHEVCWGYRFMLLILNSDHTRLHFSSLELSSLGEGVPIAVSNFCYWLTGVNPDVFFCCYSPSTSKLDMFYILRCLPAQPSCKECYLSYCGVSVSSHQSRQSSVTSLINYALLFTELMLSVCFWHYSVL